MKTIVLAAVTIVFLFIVESTMAQISIGPKAGLTISRFAGDDEADLDGIKNKISFRLEE